MLTDEDLEHPVSHQLVEGEQLAVCRSDRLGIFRIHCFASGFERVRSLFDDRIGQNVAGHFPESDEAVDGRREADGKHAAVTGGSRRFVVQVERAVIVVAAEQYQHVQPVEGVHEANGDIDVMLQPVTIVDVEMPEFAGQECSRQGRARRPTPHELV